MNNLENNNNMNTNNTNEKQDIEIIHKAIPLITIEDKSNYNKH